ncbi:flagellar motor protein MotB [Paenibacillus sp. YN15]|uniref:flagellar motor protein MotB n=1 Tax=Paenibacillus sp. YN15 TaxID=1742774 RepID=UPI00215C71A7|nr:flagellar motor protein MotB [Paenibacillus sp. YN15]
MRRGNRKKGNTSGNHERWLITYSDLITLLLIFFVVMYAWSKVDTAKYEALSKSLHLEFAKGETILEKHNGPAGDLKQGQGEIVTPPPTSSPSPSAASAREERERELQDLLSKVNQYIQENNLQAQVTAGDVQRGVVIKLNDMVLFDLGKADLKPASLPILDKLGSLFRSLDTKVSIEGHTDNLPLQTGSLYKDNWGLSQARSVSVVRYLLSTPGMNDNMFVSSAYADTMPVAPNDTEENRAKNRRVEIVVLREPLKLN